MDLMARIREAAQGNTTAWSCEDRAAAYNSREGNLQGYDCPICRNKGNSMVIRDGCEYMVECRCMETRRGLWRLESSGLADMVGRYRFDTFGTKKKYQQTMKDMAEAFCEVGKGWFFVGGQAGSGKTHICTAIANTFMEQGKTVRYMIWLDEVTKLKALKMDEEGYAKEIQSWKRPQVLYIDDFFKTRNGAMPTDADVNIAFELVNARYNDRNLITIFSGERTMQEVIDIDEALGSRIYQRCGMYKLSIGRSREKNYRLQEEEV